MSIMMMIAVVLVLLLVMVMVLVLKKSSSSSPPKINLPPGSMGWPYVGETFQMYSQDPNMFFAAKQLKYGPVFKTHILGCPCVMMASPDAAKFVLLSHSHLFKPTFPHSKQRMLGPHALFFHQGPYHLRLRRVVLRAFSPDSIRPLVPHLHAIAQASLARAHAHSQSRGVLNAFQHMKTYAFEVALLSIFGDGAGSLDSACRDRLMSCYYVLEQGYNSMPINLPGTLFHSSIRARNELARIIARLISSARESEEGAGGLLGSLMAEKEGLSDEQIADNIIGVIFAARDTTASVLTWILKFLKDNPAVLQAVTEEQEGIIMEKVKNGSEKALTWADSRKMPMTSRVIQETLRVASVLSFTFREAVEEVEYEGYVIPKGWKVLPLFRNIHHSPHLFPEPDKFDPARFEAGPPKRNSYMPFGNGIHSCPGNELAKLEMLILIHHLTTNYRWNVVGAQTGIQYGPFALPHNGLPITLHSIHQQH